MQVVRPAACTYDLHPPLFAYIYECSKNCVQRAHELDLCRLVEAHGTHHTSHSCICEQDWTGQDRTGQESLPRAGCVGKAVAPRRLGVMPRMVT